jgi:hypothetical protein
MGLSFLKRLGKVQDPGSPAKLGGRLTASVLAQFFVLGIKQSRLSARLSVPVKEQSCNQLFGSRKESPMPL